jgi:hypothetical protein
MPKITIKKSETESITISYEDGDIYDMREIFITLLIWYGYHPETIEEILPEKD